MADMANEKPLSKDTVAIIIAIIMAAIAIIGINKADIGDVRTEIRELRGLLIGHIAGHSHAPGTVVAQADGAKANEN